MIGLHAKKTTARVLMVSCALCAMAVVFACGPAVGPSGSYSTSFDPSASAPSFDTAVAEADPEATRAVDRVFADLAAGDETASAALCEAVWFYPSDYGVSDACFARTYFQGFSYQMGEATLWKDGTVSVAVQVSVHPSAQLLALLAEARQSALAAGSDDAGSDDARPATGYADEFFEQAVAQNPWDTQTSDVDVVVEKGSDGAWQVTDRGLVAAVLLGGLDPRQDMQ